MPQNEDSKIPYQPPMDILMVSSVRNENKQLNLTAIINKAGTL